MRLEKLHVGGTGGHAQDLGFLERLLVVAEPDFEAVSCCARLVNDAASTWRCLIVSHV
jgi:hypothetical protein